MDLDNEEQGSNKKRKAKASKQDGVQESNKKLKAKASEQDGVQESANKSKKKKNQKEEKKGRNATNEEKKAIEQVKTGNVLKKQETSQISSDTKAQNETVTNAMGESSKTRLIVEELHKGNPNAKIAKHGNTVAVRYFGKAKDNKDGKVFVSNIGKSAINFRLGYGQVIDGLDAGVDGMRVGDKRKLTIPPEMGYGSEGAGDDIPANSWLTYEVELIDVR